MTKKEFYLKFHTELADKYNTSYKVIEYIRAIYTYHKFNPTQIIDRQISKIDRLHQQIIWCQKKVERGLKVEKNNIEITICINAIKFRTKIKELIQKLHNKEFQDITQKTKYDK